MKLILKPHPGTQIGFPGMIEVYTPGNPVAWALISIDTFWSINGNDIYTELSKQRGESPLTDVEIEVNLITKEKHHDDPN